MEEYPIPFEGDTFVHGNSIDELVRKAKIEHLKQYGVDELTIQELIPGGLFERHYDQFARMLAAGMSPEDAHEAVFHIDLNKDEDPYMNFMKLGVPHDISKAASDLDHDQRDIMFMALREGYEPQEAYELALTKNPEEANKEIIGFLSHTGGQFKNRGREMDDILHERLERLRADD